MSAGAYESGGLASELTGDLLPELFRTIKQLPSPPEVCLSVMRAAKDEETSAADLGKLIESDPALTAKVLRIANSAFFGFSQEITTVRRATVLMGFTAIKTIALGFFLHNELGKLRIEGLDYPNLAAYSLAASAVCETVASVLCDRDRYEAATAGLLHEVGVLAMAMAYGDRYRRLVASRGTSGLPLHVVEREGLGVDHARAGRLLLAEWRLPERLLAVVEAHHDPETQEADPGTVPLRKIVALGSRAALLYFDTARDEAAAGAAGAAARLFGWGAGELVPVLRKAREAFAARFQCFQDGGESLLTEPERMEALYESLGGEAQRPASDVAGLQAE